MLLIIAVCAVFLIAEFENLLDYHAITGYTIGLLLLFRVVWGFLDIKHSKFKDFNFDVKDLKEYMLNIFGNKKEYAGHNPASSWAIIAMIILSLASVVSGVIVFGTQEGMGVLSFLNTSRYKDMDFFEDLHEFFTNAFMFVVFVHIAGASLDKILHKSKSVESMIYGYKDGDGKSVKLTRFQQLFGVLWIVLPLFLFIYLLLAPSNILIKDSNKAVDYKAEHAQFYKECISCHTLYPPYLLPKESWVKMMDDLENHFGDDASLEETDKNSIKNYLVKNSAETSTKESAWKILKSIKNSDTIAITKTQYWQNRHNGIDKSIFKSKKVGSISNCKACHKNIERGLLNDKDIQIAKGV